MDDSKPRPAPNCPNCAKPMRFTHQIPAIGALPDLYSYYCDSCGEAVTEVAEPGERRDLLASFETGRAVALLVGLFDVPFETPCRASP
jgi:hypothetical protein